MNVSWLQNSHTVKQNTELYVAFIDFSVGYHVVLNKFILPPTIKTQTPSRTMKYFNSDSFFLSKYPTLHLLNRSEEASN